MNLRPLLPALCTALLLAGHASAELNQPPPQFTALFNGKDLTGWRGGSTFDPRKLDAMTEEERAAKLAQWTGTMREHWRVENGELINDGKGDYATTDKDYGDFELFIDYKTVPLADSGIYLRGCPQVQIWDYTEKAKFALGADKGSGGLWNNARSPGKDPLVLADKPFGEWNHFHIIMVGARISVWLNDKLVVDHAILENYYDKSQAARCRRAARFDCKRTAAKFAGGMFSSARSAPTKPTSSCAAQRPRRVSSRLQWPGLDRLGRPAR